MSTLRKLKKRENSSSQRIVPLRYEQTPSMRKMSEVLLEFAQPMLRDSDSEEFHAIISLAALCWNCTFCPESEQQEALEEILGKINESDAEMRLEITQNFQMFIRRKQKFFADDKRIIEDYRIIDEENDHHLIVASVLTA